MTEWHSMDQYLVHDVLWKRTNADTWTCCLLSRSDAFHQIWLVPGDDLFLYVRPHQHCIGYTTYSSATYVNNPSQSWQNLHPCPTSVRLKKGVQCTPCSLANSLHPCTICTGTRCLAPPSIEKNCQSTTSYVYLATFGLGQVKVGVAKETRIPVRWIEQGANLAKRILVGNGSEVRRFENVLHHAVPVLPSLKTDQKVEGLWRTDIHADLEVLAAVEHRIRTRLPTLPFVQDEVHDLSPVYHLPVIDQRPLQLTVTDNRQISGTILGVKGALLILQIGQLPHVINLNHLIGRKLELKTSAMRSIQTPLDRY